jgi:hypothetical protein
MDRNGTDFRVFLDLRDVLPAISPVGHAWRWAIRGEPELSARPRWDLNLPYIREHIERSPRGFVLSFEELDGAARRVVASGRYQSQPTKEDRNAR